MRKKYLSALLFGALLLASAGTFTSCSDYDDDIKNLQEQINTVVSDLESLKTKVDGLGGYVTDVKVENGKLVVTANGSTVSYDLPAGGSSEVANIEIKNGHLYVNGTDKGSVGSTVTVNENGELVIDGEVSDLKVGTEVIIKDATNGVYTISIDGQTIQLPMVTASVSVENLGTTAFGALEGGSIYWGKATAAYDWKGPKGAIVKDQYLFGQISDVQISVLPAAYDLSQQELKLVNSKGEYAPVTVTATACDEVVAEGSRAAGNVWNLSIAMAADAESDSFANEDGDKNVNYALSVNGTIVTGYTYFVKVNSSEGLKGDFSQNNMTLSCDGATAVAISGGTVSLTGVKVGKNELVIRSTNGNYDASKIYDAYITLDDEDAAAEYGITVEGMTITASDKAKSVSNFPITIKAIAVTGLETNVTTFKANLSFENATVDGEAIADQTYKLVNKDYVVVDLGNTFTSLSDADANKVGSSTGSIEWSFAKGSKTFGEKTVTVSYFEDAELKKPVTTATAATIKKIKYATIATSQFAGTPEVGVNNLTITLKSNADEVKKVTTALTIEVPSFDEVFSINENSGLWKDGKYTSRMSASSSTAATVPFGPETFIIKDSKNPFGVTVPGIAYDMTYVDAAGEEQTVDDQDLLKAGSSVVTKEGNLVAKEYAITATAKIANIEISKKFTLNLMSMFEGAELKYYTGDKNTLSDYAVVSDKDLIKAFEDKKDGLKLEFNGKSAPLTNSTIIGVYTVTVASNTAVTTPDAVTTIDANATVDTTTGSMGSISAVDESGVTLSNIGPNQSGTLVIEFMDITGVKTKASILYKK